MAHAQFDHVPDTVPIGTPIALLFIAAALEFFPSILNGGTLGAIEHDRSSTGRSSTGHRRYYPSPRLLRRDEKTPRLRSIAAWMQLDRAVEAWVCRAVARHSPQAFSCEGVTRT